MVAALAGVALRGLVIQGIGGAIRGGLGAGLRGRLDLAGSAGLGGLDRALRPPNVIADAVIEMTIRGGIVEKTKSKSVTYKVRIADLDVIDQTAIAHATYWYGYDELEPAALKRWPRDTGRSHDAMAGNVRVSKRPRLTSKGIERYVVFALDPALDYPRAVEAGSYNERTGRRRKPGKYIKRAHQSRRRKIRDQLPKRVAESIEKAYEAAGRRGLRKTIKIK